MAEECVIAGAPAATAGEQEPALPTPGSIRAIVFDLDGTLYVSDAFAACIQEGAVIYLAALLGVEPEQARAAMAEARHRLAPEPGACSTLSAVCSALGGTLPGLHAFFQDHLRPESYLVPDPRVVDLLECLSHNMALYLYTNNSRAMAERIVALLGLGGVFRGVFAIDDCWRAKPDQAALERVLAAVGEPTDRVLFVGDRFEVDLRLPHRSGCPVLLTRSVEELLSLRWLTMGRDERP